MPDSSKGFRHRIVKSKGVADRARSDKARSILDAAPSHDGFSALAGHTYMLLATYKRDGDAVVAPVWFGLENERLYVWTEINAYKAKRLRRDERALVAPCGALGEPKGGPIAATGRVLEDPAERAHAARVIKGSWGPMRRLFERMSRPVTDVLYIELTPA